MPSTELFALEYLNSISLKVIYIKSNKNPNYLSAFRSRRGVLGVYDSLPGYLSASSYQISDLWPCFKKGKVGGGVACSFHLDFRSRRQQKYRTSQVVLRIKGEDCNIFHFKL